MTLTCKTKGTHTVNTSRVRKHNYKKTKKKKSHTVKLDNNKVFQRLKGTSQPLCEKCTVTMYSTPR